jgi:hypothetical protein
MKERHMKTIVTLVLAALAAGCQATPPQREPDEYDGCATDENWRTFDDKETTHQVTVDDSQAPSYSTPAGNGMSFPSSAPATFAWNLTPTLPGKPTGDATCTRCPSCGPLLPSHLPPVSGDVFDLQFSTGGTVVYRVITTLQTWAASTAVLSGWSGKQISLATVRVTLSVNDVTEGPFEASSPLTFSVQ